ncbi:hypothetical protein C477_07498 [Haloterrigena salina JCM 13891]|uniref:Uncharacterized protein n=1 Tax=Haloterrigena salina JCM 13891 TaxID=1227488 RepID=M0C995_9EURY|nr:hypothetical protein [Haloterrigena salina]ELZ19805.1 hypothetical protein C477_07498 [Haloterrigena salina JCM 13891]
MSEEHDHDLSTELPTEATEKLDEYDVDDPIGAVLSIVGGDLKAAVPLLGGGVVLLSALKSLGKGQLRAIPKAAVAAGLFSYGLRNRGGDEAETFQPTLADIEGGTEGKDVSDAAHAAAERPDSGQESEIDASGDVHESAQLGDEGETGSRIEFSDETDEEETRTKPDHVGDEEDPRRDTGDDDETVEVDVSDTAMAEETSEATGPDPEQAQPSQTDAIEPEETPEEDASDMKVEPDEDADSTDDEDEATEDGDDEDQ